MKLIWKVIMANWNQIKTEKAQYEINREVTKVSALSPGKIDKYKYLAGDNQTFHQSKLIEWVRFTYS